MARKSICSDCGEVLEPTNKEYVVCGNCGEFNWVGPEQRVEFEPTPIERLRTAAKKYKTLSDREDVPGKFRGNNKVMKGGWIKRKSNKKFS